MSQSEIAMHEKELKNSAFMRQFVAEDLKSLTRKLKTAYDDGESMLVTIRDLEQQCSALGLDNTSLLQKYDQLQGSFSSMRHEIDTLRKDFANRSKALEKRVVELKKQRETKSKQLEIIESQEADINRGILNLKRQESEQELTMINRIAFHEKLKIMMLTGDTRILKEENIQTTNPEPQAESTRTKLSVN